MFIYTSAEKSRAWTARRLTIHRALNAPVATDSGIKTGIKISLLDFSFYKIERSCSKALSCRFYLGFIFFRRSFFLMEGRGGVIMQI